MADTDKLAELSAKTDHELYALISSRLDRGLTFARLLLDEESRRSWACMDEFAARAEQAHSDVARLLPVLRGITQGERRCLESRLTQLRDVLDCAAMCTAPRVHTAGML